jgi:hypothetical protein
MRALFLLLMASLILCHSSIQAAIPTDVPAGSSSNSSAEDRQRILGGMPTRSELKLRRARATNAPVTFLINGKTERLEAKDIDGALIQEYSPGAVGHVLDVGGYELKISFGRDEHQRLSLLLRPGPSQLKPVQVSVFQRRLILPPSTSVSAFLDSDGVVTIEPCLTGTIYYLDTQPTAVDLPEDKVKLLASKNLVRIGRDVEQGKLPDEEMVDAVVEGKMETEEKQTPKNNAGLAVGGWFQNAGVSLLGLPNPQTTPPATVVKVASGTPELSAPAPQNQTPNFDPSPVATGKNVPSKQVTQNVKVIALKGDLGEATIAREPFVYEEGDKKDLAKASKQGLVPRPLENPEMAPVAPAATLDQKPPGDAAGNAVVRAVRSFLGMPEAKTVQAEADKLAGKKE